MLDSVEPTVLKDTICACLGESCSEKWLFCHNIQCSKGGEIIVYLVISVDLSKVKWVV
jgi:hypothetical protein